MNRLRCTLALSFLVAALHSLAAAETAAQPVGQGSGPVTDLSTNVGAGSGSVHDSVGRGAFNAGRLGGNSVRGSATGDVVSGPVSDLSVGAVTADNPVSGGGTVGQSSVGAVKKDIDSPLGEMISQPLRELGPLQARLRAIQPAPRTGPVPGEEAAPADTTGETADTATQEQVPAVEPEPAGEADEPEADADEEPEATPGEAIEAPAATHD